MFPFSVEATTMLCDSSGNIVIGGNAGSLPALAKFHPDTGLMWTYSYPIEEGNQGQFLAMTVDTADNIYGYLHSAIANHWVQKFTPSGDTLSTYTGLEAEYISSIRSFGHVELTTDNQVQVLTEIEAGEQIVVYTFDTAFSILLDSTSYSVNSEVYCCFNSVLPIENTLLFNGVVNETQGVYDLTNNQLSFYPFIGHQFIELGFDLIGESNNEYFIYSNNYQNIGGDTLFTLDPEVVIFDQEWRIKANKNLFTDTIQNGTTAVRPSIRDAIIHPEYGIIACGAFSNGFSSPYDVTNFIIQINPNTLEIEHRYLDRENRFFTHLTQFNEHVYVIDRPFGFPNGMNVFKLNLQKITNVEEVASVANPSFTVYPNPTTGHIQILVEPSTIVEKIQIYDISGRLVYQSTLPENKPIRISQPGTYLVQIYTSTSVTTQKVVVTR
jgi:hypothetical protein